MNDVVGLTDLCTTLDISKGSGALDLVESYQRLLKKGALEVLSPNGYGATDLERPETCFVRLADLERLIFCQMGRYGQLHLQPLRVAVAILRARRNLFALNPLTFYMPASRETSVRPITCVLDGSSVKVV